MDSSLSIIIPTMGRESLKGVLGQIQEQLHDCDEVLVIGDGLRERAEQIVNELSDSRIKYFQYGESPTMDFGNILRNYGMSLATGSHLYFIDDDDELLPGALDNVRAAISEHPSNILIFKIEHNIEGVLWKSHEIRLGKISTQMFVVPNVKAWLGTWPLKYYGDFEFLKECVKLNPNPVVWRGELIAKRVESPKPKDFYRTGMVLKTKPEPTIPVPHRQLRRYYRAVSKVG